MITCKFENGGKANLRHVTTDCLIVDEEKILLVKRADHFLEGGKYALPGGYLDPGETTKQGVVREALEETGYEVDLQFLLHINDDPDRKRDERQNVTFYYVAHPVKKVQEADEESTDIRWFAFDALPPREQTAFDHYEEIQMYLAYREKKFAIPIVGKYNAS
jgi:8-oxo-dGTP diphosphatase